MKRLRSLLLLLMILTGCAPAAQPAVGLTFVDDAGISVTVPPQPKKVAVLFSSFAEVWQLAGGEVSVTVAESVERGFAPETAVLVDGGAGKHIDLELLVAQEPDFVLCSADVEAQSQCAAALNAAGIPTAQMRVECFADYLRLLRLCCDLTGNGEAYAQYGTAVQARVDAILAETHDTAPRVLFLRAGSGAGSTKAKQAGDHFAAAMLQELGAENLADSVPVLLDGLSLEAILLADPDQIFISTMGDAAAAQSYVESLFAQEGWRELRAVQSGRYHFLPKELFHYKPNARWAEAYDRLAALLYDDAR